VVTEIESHRVLVFLLVLDVASMNVFQVQNLVETLCRRNRIKLMSRMGLHNHVTQLNHIFGNSLSNQNLHLSIEISSLAATGAFDDAVNFRML
jgi:hypothetical protein